MSDFNKGDFTQQGVDGHVRATLRLNEKRYVELDLTTNENARGCTIAGNVHDRLNNLDYPIGAAPSGNIEITENTAEGEPLDVSQYATATVNVARGDGDFVYIVNENVVLDENSTGTVSNVNTSELSNRDAVLCYISNDIDDLFSVGIYSVAGPEQSFDVKTYDGADFHVFTDDGITWQADVSPIASATIKLVIIKMPDFYSAN